MLHTFPRETSSTRILRVFCVLEEEGNRMDSHMSRVNFDQTRIDLQSLFKKEHD